MSKYKNWRFENADPRLLCILDNCTSPNYQHFVNASVNETIVYSNLVTCNDILLSSLLVETHKFLVDKTITVIKNGIRINNEFRRQSFLN